MDRDSALDWLEKRLGRYRRAREFHNFCCPFCDDSKYRFGVNLTTGRCYCFKCETKGSVKKVLGLNFRGRKVLATNRLAHRAKGLAPSSDPKTRPWKDLPEPHFNPDAKVTTLASQVFKYLEGRGVDAVTAGFLGLGYGTQGKWAGRVIFPFYHTDGRLAGWQGRATDDHPAKSLTTKEEDLPGALGASTGAVYGLERIRKGAPVVVTEGPFDALSVSCVQPAVAILGSKLHPAQVRRIMREGPSEIIVAFDADKPKSALKACATIWKHSRTMPTLVRWPDDWPTDVDLGDLDAESVGTVLREYAGEWRPGMLR